MHESASGRVPAATPAAHPEPALQGSAVFEGPSLEALLPHRFPFLLVDRIRIVEVGRHVVGTKRVTAGEWWCPRDGSPTIALPFSLVIESMAQTTSALLMCGTDGTRGAIGYFVAADRIRFRGLARPGDELQLAMTLQSSRRGICRTTGVATVDGCLVASATLTTILRSAPG